MDVLIGDYIAPQTKIEQEIVHIWSELLGIEASKISRNANFFELGGHSLLTVKLATEINRRCNTKISLDRFFSAVTVEAMAKLCEGYDTAKSYQVIKPISLLHGDKDELFMIPGVASTENDFAWLAAQLSAHGYRIYACPHKGLLDGTPPYNSVEENVTAIVNGIVQQSKDTQGIRLIGHSFGGLLALEAANQLSEQGIKVELILIDSYFEQHRQHKKHAAIDGGEISNDKPLPKDIDSLLMCQLEALERRQSQWLRDYIPSVHPAVTVKYAYATQSNFCIESYHRYFEKHHDKAVEYTSINAGHMDILKSDDLVKLMLEQYLD